MEGVASFQKSNSLSWQFQTTVSRKAHKLPAFKHVASEMRVPLFLILLQEEFSYEVSSSYDNKSSQKRCKMLTNRNNHTSKSNFVLNKNQRINFGWKCTTCCQTDLIKYGCSVFMTSGKDNFCLSLSALYLFWLYSIFALPGEIQSQHNRKLLVLIVLSSINNLFYIYDMIYLHSSSAQNYIELLDAVFPQCGFSLLVYLSFFLKLS